MPRRSYGNYTKQQVIERDKATCWICFQPIDLTLKYPHPRSLTMDHIIPLSKGGKDTIKNVAIAHYICNETKKDSLPCEFFTNIEGVLYRNYGKTAILMIIDSDEELITVLTKLKRTRNKKMKNFINRICEALKNEII